jgi:hypothetical protein
MTALDRARGWFLAPPPATSPVPAARTDWPAESSAEPASTRRPARGPAEGKHRPAAPERPAAASRRPRGPAPLADGPPDAALAVDSGGAAFAVDSGGALTCDPDGVALAVDSDGAARASHGGLAVGALSADPLATAPRATIGGWRPPVAGAPLAAPSGRGGWQPPVAGDWIVAPPDAVAAAVASAAVLGRPGEVEPIAAALALALRRETRARAAAVAVVGAMAPGAGAETSSGTAARRLGAHGLEARVRGRLAWVRLDPEDPQLVSAARRLTLVAAPAVLAITAPRTAAIDEALAESDLLVIVTADPDGPLARLAAAGLDGVPLVTVRPLGRGLSRSLARAGVRAPRPLRALLATAPEAGS